MAGTATLPELQAKHEQDLDSNRLTGVVEWGNGEKQSDRVYEVVDGYKTVWVDGAPVRLGPGQRFRPTERNVRDNSLRGKARELTESEYRSIRRDERPAVSTGADFETMRLRGLAELPMADSTRKLAEEAGLEASDFRGVEPGSTGNYTRAVVEEIIAKAKTTE